MPSGSCFCKAFKFSVETAPQKVTSCTCSFCTKRGALWAYFEPSELEFTVTGKGTWENPAGPKHNFCATCGCTTYSESPTFEAPEGEDPNYSSKFEPNFDKIRISINARLFDDIDWHSIPVEEIDGKNLW